MNFKWSVRCVKVKKQHNYNTIYRMHLRFMSRQEKSLASNLCICQPIKVQLSLTKHFRKKGSQRWTFSKCDTNLMRKLEQSFFFKISTASLYRQIHPSQWSCIIWYFPTGLHGLAGSFLLIVAHYTPRSLEPKSRIELDFVAQPI